MHLYRSAIQFTAATGVDANAIVQMQAPVRRRLLRAFVRRGLLPGDDARAMGQWAHGGGFSVDGSLLLTPLELIDRIAALVPPPRIHRHRYFGVLAPHSPLRAAVTALALAATTSPPAANPQPAAEPAHRRAARFAWALLLARIYAVFPLVCSHCGGAMRIIAFTTDGPAVRDILDHLGEPTAPTRIAPARGPRVVTLAPAPARKCHHQRAEQPVAAANPRLTRPVGASTLSLVRLK